MVNILNPKILEQAYDLANRVKINVGITKTIVNYLTNEKDKEPLQRVEVMSNRLHTTVIERPTKITKMETLLDLRRNNLGTRVLRRRINSLEDRIRTMEMEIKGLRTKTKDSLSKEILSMCIRITTQRKIKLYMMDVGTVVERSMRVNAI